MRLRTASFGILILAALCWCQWVQAFPSDKQIARQAVIHGNNLLSVNPKSSEGTALVRLGLSLLPEDEDGLLALALAERGSKPKPVKTKIKLEQLTGVMIQRAGQLLDKYPATNRSKMLLALYYLRAAEPFDPTDRDLLIALKRLERDGYDYDANALAGGLRTVEYSWGDSPSAGDTNPGGDGPENEEPEEPQTGLDLAPEDAKEFRGHKYKYFDGKLSWDAAKRKCEEMGGTLVCISSAAENDFVKSVAGGRRAWLGATDSEREGRWCWVRRGATWTYRNWVRTIENRYNMSDKKRQEYEEAAYDERHLNNDAGDYLYMCPNGKWNARSVTGGWERDSGSSYYSYLTVVGYICEWQR